MDEALARDPQLNAHRGTAHDWRKIGRGIGSHGFALVTFLFASTVVST